MLYRGALTGKRWTRFPKFEYDDYFRLSKNHWDAICLKPKSDVMIMGFGFLNHYEKQAFKLTFKIKVDDVDTPEYVVDLTQSQLEEDNPVNLYKSTFLIDLEMVGG
jgi:hypothetical protein